MEHADQSDPTISGMTARAARKAARRAENKAVWAVGGQLPRWSRGGRPSRAGPRTGPAPYETGTEQRKAAKDLRRAANRAAWAAQQETARQVRAAAREQARLERRAADRARAAAWHADRREDASITGSELAGSDQDLLRADDYAATGS